MWLYGPSLAPSSEAKALAMSWAAWASRGDLSSRKASASLSLLSCVTGTGRTPTPAWWIMYPCVDTEHG